MQKSIGQIIKILRKKKNITQEDLALFLNVSAQAVSKWENESCMPDVTQIVLLARIFGVSTDVILGIFGENTDAEAVVMEAIKGKPTYEKYLSLLDALKNYPHSITIMEEILEYGLMLAYPENEKTGTYDKIHAQIIYEECIRVANLLIAYAPTAQDKMTGHRAMILLHAAYENWSEAEKHIQFFYVRADLN